MTSQRSNQGGTRKTEREARSPLDHDPPKSRGGLARLLHSPRLPLSLMPRHAGRRVICVEKPSCRAVPSADTQHTLGLFPSWFWGVHPSQGTTSPGPQLHNHNHHHGLPLVTWLPHVKHRGEVFQVSDVPMCATYNSQKKVNL